MQVSDRAHGTRMFVEASEAAETVRRQFAFNADQFEEIVARLDRQRPNFLLTCARGSSDNAATYAKYLVERLIGLPVASFAPSMASIYKAPLRLEGSAWLTISQSGRSPDLLAATLQGDAAGAYTIGLLNDVSSPIGKAIQAPLDLCAGTETSVAATKSFIASMAAILAIVAKWSRSEETQAALTNLPDLLAESWEQPWGALTEGLLNARSVYVLGRGIGFASAQEAALKLKETCGIHAEAISAAEVRHGPLALVEAGFPVIVFCQDDESAVETVRAARDLRDLGARIFMAGSRPEARSLPVINAPAVAQPILQIQSFYRAANDLALARGLHPDEPRNLRKVTQTV